MDVQAIATQVLDAIKEAPETAQQLVSDPKGAIEGITGATGFDVTEVLQSVLERVGDLGVDLSGIDLGQLDLSQLDLGKLDVNQLAQVAQKAGINVDVAGLAAKALGGQGGLGGLLGGIFGGK